MNKCLVVALAILVSADAALCQISAFPYTEAFDTVMTPTIPSGWVSSQNRSPGTNDFTTTSSSVLSPPNAVLSTNSTIEQYLRSPLFDFTAAIPDSLVFFTRRSATHTSGVLVEVSLDGGTTFALSLGDTLINPSNTNYNRRTFSLPDTLRTATTAMFQWRSLANGTGSTGTFRIDEMRITVRTAQDLSLDSLTFSPRLPAGGEPVTSNAFVRNRGLKSANDFSIEVYEDVNRDSLPDPSELITVVQNSAPLQAGDSLVALIPLGSFTAGVHRTIARIVFAPDGQLFNNQRYASLVVGYPPATVVINEIMYAPIGTEPEWVEIYVLSDTVDLHNWLVSDNIVTTKRTITDSPLVLAPREYCILTRDSAALRDAHTGITAPIIQIVSFPTLNNTGDAVVIYDLRGIANDSLSYLPSWGGGSGGFSLERIDPSGSSLVQTNWSNSTAFMRSTPGRRNSVTRKDYDIALSPIAFSPVFPLSTDSLSISLTISNIGFQIVPGFTADLFLDADADSSIDPGELLAAINHNQEVQPLDSIRLLFDVAPLPSGLHQFIGRAAFAADEDTGNNKRVSRIDVLPPAGSVRINEIMYSPTGAIPEWLEVANVSPDAIILDGWKIGNRLNRYTVPLGVNISSGGFVVFAKDTALMRQAYQSIPGRAVQMTSLPTFLWNNGGDAVVLQHGGGTRVDSFSYSPGWGGTNGESLERIDLLSASQDSTNWGSSRDSLGATPGRKNSVVPLDNDLEITGRADYSFRVNDPVDIFFTARNVGKLDATPFTVELYLDENGDSVATPSELTGSIQFSQTLSTRDSIVGTFSPPLPTGTHALILLLRYTLDERIADNLIFVQVRIGYPSAAVIINEIMYEPLSGKAEYVELYNPSDRDISLAGWSITDLPSSTGSVNKFTIREDSAVISPHGYFVIASDTSIFRQFPLLSSRSVFVVGASSLSMNNGGDAVVIRDNLGTAIDSVFFLPSWHNPGVSDETGRSLEKILFSSQGNDRRSWSTCALAVGGTPGVQNSIFTVVRPSAKRISFQPNPFSPDGDGQDDFTIILYELPLQVSMLSVKIYDVQGRSIRHLASNEPSGSIGQIIWDGRDNDGNKARMGMYVVLLEAIDELGGVIETLKGVVVLAGRL